MKFSFLSSLSELLQSFNSSSTDKVEEKLLSKKEIEGLNQSLKVVKGQHSPLVITSEFERKIIEDIKREIKINNKNNVTRTSAYFKYFVNNKELHWAFLAHMVSRNGGYYMTDIKSFFLDDLIPLKDRDKYFLFLEQCNSYIFQDAFPQLLLYEYSKKYSRSLFHLLKAFHVSSFMYPFWELFLSEKNSQVITIAMIINEQKMIERRIIEGIYHSKTILDELPFLLQEELGFTTVLFPYKWTKKKTTYRLCGQVIKGFAKVEERIQTGKRLYRILFSEGANKTSYQFAEQTKHSGSRADYWDWLFSDTTGKDSKLYSPRLEEAWPNMPTQLKQKSDWYDKEKSEITEFFYSLPIMTDIDLTHSVLKQYSILASLDHLVKKLF
ncbi:DUF2515 family protein [Bacillus sp. 31A1R]|uniref:DUF2515 family protein n=1 Tax=Robertmurraya mangrovi TaxID=3098077 RepID=A0ABU5J5F5_9BACI|nr:DUF2515 family protein [Bacillus sp. 31A1R]MDZ5474654.1 DUF2515 family protein [Bacillus sp. 31A1R]